MAISPEKIELGILSPNEIVEGAFWVKNIGNGELNAVVRSGCDCIELENNLPESIAPNDSAKVSFVYYAPDSVVSDTSSIFISADDENIQPQKLLVIASIKARKLAKGDSTITIVPFATGQPQMREITDKIMQSFFGQVKEKLNFQPVNPSSIIQHIVADKKYGKEPIHKVIRKWALMDSIRWVIACQLSMENTIVKGQCSVVDGFAEFPMPLDFEAPVDKVADVFMDSVEVFFQHIGERYKDAMIKGMQQKWALQRREIMNKPLPEMKFVDVRTGDTLTGESTRGNILLMHFFGIDCEHCEQEVEWMRKLVESHPENLIVWGISVDIGMQDSVELFARERKLPYPVVLPTAKSHRRLTRIYGGATPQTILADENGVVREFFVGFNSALVQRLEKTIQTLSARMTSPKSE